MTTPPTAWITRTRPGAEATAGRVRAAGMEALIAPLLDVVFEPGGEIDLSGVEALAFSSANGVRAFAARTAERSLPVFAVGRGTATAAREAGFTEVTAGDGDVLALADAIPQGRRVLHPGAAEPAADLVQALERRGVRAHGIVVYRTVASTPSRADLALAGQADFVLLQSAKAARAFRDLGLDGALPVCLSPAVADALGAPAGRRIVIAAAPTEDALIEALIEAAR